MKSMTIKATPKTMAKMPITMPMICSDKPGTIAMTRPIIKVIIDDIVIAVVIFLKYSLP